MKTTVRTLAALLPLLCLAAFARPAHGQYLGQFGPLNRMGDGQKSLGLYLGSGPVGLGPLAEVRANYGSHGTVGVQAGLADKIFALQGDLRAGIMGTGGDFPVELGGELAGGLVTGGGDTGIYGQLVPALSFEVDAGSGQSWAGWAGLGYRVTASNKRIGSGAGIFRVGGRFTFSRQLGMAANLEDVAGSGHLLVGVEYRFGGGGASNVPGGR
ncbi:MAG: hypothetical protein HZB25_03995 [Candidatus Eisenbacteria bacterium]|nr:hypothetical protein [Candidatus Eisenbacteria bacterium]